MKNYINETVKVHPNLLYDAAYKQGEMGNILSMDLQSDSVLVKFEDDSIGHYSANALLVLKPAKQLYADLMAYPTALPPAEFKKLLEMNMLQDSQKHDELRERFHQMDDVDTLELGARTLQNQMRYDDLMGQDRGLDSSSVRR